MSKKGWIAIIAVAFIGLSFIIFLLIVRFSGVIQSFRVSGSSNEPTFYQGDIFFVSNIKHPKRHDFVCFNSKNYNGKDEIHFHRLCGMEGDTVMIKNGDLYINGKSGDIGLQLKHVYAVKSTLLQSMEKQKIFNPDKDFYYSVSDTSLIFLDDKIAVSKHAYRHIKPAEETDEFILKAFKQSWNADNFGPVVVPRKSYFLLGDNRNNALDSRYLGFIKQEDVVGTALKENK